MAKRGRTGDINRFVGQRIIQLRALNSMTQQQLADNVGITYQQIHKYEKGINRLAASKLHAIAKVLNVPISALFDGYAEVSTQVDDGPDPQISQMLLSFLQTFLELEPKHQEILARAVRALAA